MELNHSFLFKKDSSSFLRLMKCKDLVMLVIRPALNSFALFELWITTKSCAYLQNWFESIHRDPWFFPLGHEECHCVKKEKQHEQNAYSSLF